MKTLKFRKRLVPLVLSGDKNVTWRLFDDKNLEERDIVDLINWNTGEKFGSAILTRIKIKKMCQLQEEDFIGHEKFESEEEMFSTYRKYYGDKVGKDTEVKIISFKLIK